MDRRGADWDVGSRWLLVLVVVTVMLGWVLRCPSMVPQVPCVSDPLDEAQLRLAWGEISPVVYEEIRPMCESEG